MISGKFLIQGGIGFSGEALWLPRGNAWNL